MNLKKKFLSRTAIGTFISISDSFVADILGSSGFDFAIIDTEHYSMPAPAVRNLVYAACAAQLSTIIRIPEISRSHIQHALETGADGILAPLVESAEAARRVVDFARYPPKGSRGYHGSTPASGFGRKTLDYLEQANANILVGVQIETKMGAENCAEICGVEGLDYILIGSGDLSLSLGKSGVFDDEFLAIVDTVIVAASNAGKFSGIYFSDPKTLVTYRDRTSFVVCGSDVGFILSASREVVRILRDTQQS